MKKEILYLIMLMWLPIMVSAQNTKLEVQIKATGGQINDTLDDETVVTLDLSSDDAEQENDEVDTPYDDDLDAGWEGAPDDQNILTLGLRFRDITIPQGAIIDSAYVEMYSHEGKTAEDTAKITIVGEDIDSAYTFDDVNFNSSNLLTDRTQTTASVNWTVAEEWVIWQPYRTPDLKSIIQEIVARSGWKSGNALAILLKGENQGPSTYENAREFEAFENISDPEDSDPDGNPGDGQNHPERVPKLVVYFRVHSSIEVPIRATGGQINDTLDDETVVTLDLSSDDAEQENDEVDTPYDDDLDAGWEGAPDDQNVLTMGLRFTHLNIPKGSVIDSAYIVMHSHEGKTANDTAKITIVCEDTDSAYTFDDVNFNSSNLLTDRTQTTASVNWTVAEEWEIWKPYRTPELKSLMQEVVDRSGWKAHNAMAFILKGENQGPSTYENAREFEAFENISDPEDSDPDGNPGDGQNHPERVPKLHVYYTGPQPQPVDIKERHVVVTAETEDDILVYPNPIRHGTLNIRFNTSSVEDADIYVYDLTGKVVKLQKIKDPQDIRINVNELHHGMYIIRAIQGKQVYTKKVIVK